MYHQKKVTVAKYKTLQTLNVSIVTSQVHSREDTRRAVHRDIAAEQHVRVRLPLGGDIQDGQLHQVGHPRVRPTQERAGAGRGDKHHAAGLNICFLLRNSLSLCVSVFNNIEN